MERPRDAGGVSNQGWPPGLTSLIDKEQLAHKLELRAGEVAAHARQKGFPTPVAYFRGRTLWDEAAVDRWLADQTPT
jgi:predicted DNA-binding transcriptional regulator AlpA